MVVVTEAADGSKLVQTVAVIILVLPLVVVVDGPGHCYCRHLYCCMLLSLLTAIWNTLSQVPICST